MRRIMPESAANMRDIGGIFTRDGKKVDYWKIIRSNLPNDLTIKDIDYLLEKGISTVIDLRTLEEIKSKPNILNQARFSYHHVEMKWAGFPGEEASIPKGYLEIIDDKPAIKKVIDIIGSSKEGVIINCNVGKDRTGVIVMLLLLLVDANDEDLIADYQLSYTYLKKAITQMHVDNPDLPIWLGNSKSEYMEETLKLFRQKYGNIGCYLNQLNLDSGLESVIYNKLVK